MEIYFLKCLSKLTSSYSNIFNLLWYACFVCSLVVKEYSERLLMCYIVLWDCVHLWSVLCMLFQMLLSAYLTPLKTADV